MVNVFMFRALNEDGDSTFYAMGQQEVETPNTQTVTDDTLSKEVSIERWDVFIPLRLLSF